MTNRNLLLAFTVGALVSLPQLVFSQSADTTRSKPIADTSHNVRTLQEVKVNVSKPLVEQSDDKIVFNVENDPASKTETAMDLLRKTPFVTVDGEDNIRVNGKSNFKVLLNGRETSMFARNLKEALKSYTIMHRAENRTAVLEVTSI